jgi:nucleoside-diphosphate-sugar epimerase
LITGGSGLIGSHLVDALLAKGDEITVLDNFSTGRPENLSYLKSESRLHIQKCDINLCKKLFIK